MTSELVFYVNGNKVNVQNPDPECSLLTYLRQELCLTGSKLGCGEGGCGACTVQATRFVDGTSRHFTLNACLAPLCSMHGLAITTVEGLGSTRTKLHPVQETLASSHGSQCGFCTPGFVMSMYTLLCKNPKPKVPDIEQAFSGNLCRCTGYRPILQGFIKLTSEYSNEIRSISNINVQLDKLEDLKVNISRLDSESLHFKSNRVEWYRPTSLTELLDLKAKYPTAKIVVGNTELGIEMKFKNMNYPVLISATHVPELNAIRRTKYGLEIGSSVTLADLEKFLETEILTNSADKTKFYVVILEMLKLFASNQIRNVAALGGNIITASPISDLNPLFVSANCLVTLASRKGDFRKINISQKFFTGYRKTVLEPDEVLVTIELPYSKTNEFYASYKQSRRRDDDIAIVNAGFKVTFDDGFSIVKEAILAYGGMAPTTIEATNTGRLMSGKKWNDEMLNEVVASLSDELFLDPGTPGGMEAYRSSLSLSFFFKFYIEVRLDLENFNPTSYEKSIRAVDLTAQERRDVEEQIPSFVQIFDDEIHSDDDDDDEDEDVINDSRSDECNFDRGDNVAKNADITTQRDFGDGRRHLTNGCKTDDATATGEKPKTHLIDARESNSSTDFMPTSSGESEKERQRERNGMKKKERPIYKAVGLPLVHLSAYKQTTGEAVYVDDMPKYRDELYLSLVLSEKAHAKIISIDPSEALKSPSVVGYLDSSDVPGSNNYGENVAGHDEQVFVTDVVKSQGQVIGAILSEDRNAGRRAACSVKVQYEEMKLILTIEEAVAQNSYLYPAPNTYANGNAEAAMETADHVIEGEVSIGGQDHFYLETNSCLVIPLEDGGVEVFSSCQHPEVIQLEGSEVLAVDQNKIVSKVIRMGGGFGGKEYRPLLAALPCLVAARKYKRPVRCILDRDEDMLITGGRHPYLAKYKVGFTREGRIHAVVLDLYANCGYSMDYSKSIMDRAIFHTENSYNIPNILVRGHLCKTNLPSNTAFRGFGVPQAFFVCETYVHEVADFLGMPAYKIKELNMYREGDKTPYKQVLENVTLEKCWNQVIEQSDFHQQLREIEEFNKKNRWKKRGISLMPLKYGCGFGYHVMCQGGALVNIYRDGSVLISHGGTEMGQGLHTKMIQIAAQVLKIPHSLVHISESNTSIIPNAVSTSGSFSSDLYGMAVVIACKKLMNRLNPYMTAHAEKGWSFWIKKAYLDRVSLSASGFYKTPNLFYDPATNSGNKYAYFSMAACCSAVEIDCLTGDHKVLRTDIVMDVGKSLNPAIDVGQIEGAFVQGYGLYTLEELKYSTDGLMYTRGPGAYKIPSIGDIPRTFNVTLLKDCPNPKAVYSSKAIGEPPLLTSVSVIEAIKFAIQSARKDAGIEEARFRLDSPATCERIRMACSDGFTKLYQKAKPPSSNSKPWFANI